MPGKPKMRFLIIDDDPDDSDIFVAYFEREFSHIKVETMTRLPDDLHDICHFDAVIVDYYLGCIEFSGMDLAKRIHAHNWRIPVLILSGQDVEGLEGLELWEYADAVLSKNDPDNCTGRMHALIRWLARLKEASA